MRQSKHLELTSILLPVSILAAIPNAQSAELRAGFVRPFQCAGPNDTATFVAVPGTTGGFSTSSNQYVRCINGRSQENKDSVGYVFDDLPKNNGESNIALSFPITLRILDKSKFDPKNVIVRLCFKPNSTVVEKNLSSFRGPVRNGSDLVYSVPGSAFTGSIPGHANCLQASVILKNNGTVFFGRLSLPIDLNSIDEVSASGMVLTPSQCEVFDSCPPPAP